MTHPRLFRVNPRNAKDRTRVVEHGSMWEDSPVESAKYPDKTLLRSTSTHYDRWWHNDQIILIPSP